ncbi:endonuclease MutS2 [candidate division TA06 bacterium]|uniref:Endonuclease MutS2 n=1 Tax=candidate division TA06 bacterium TaxID=2250710 RepID=A0A933I770_UNCT6|nr:endonuclease MutS2 [candidate division TA06 bacterium]
MNAHSLQILEFSFVRNALSQRASTPYGREEALALMPLADPDAVARMQDETAEARKFLEAGFGLDFYDLHDIRPQLEALKAEGAVMDALVLLHLARHLAAARQVRSSLGLRNEEYPLLSEQALGLCAFKELEERIVKAIEPDGRVADKASPELYHIRREQETVRQRIHSKLEDIMGREAADIQETLITIREGRYVIPVKADSKNKLKGIVHDSSASGATVYMEPLATIEMNNRMRQLFSMEKQEVERILRQFSTEVSENIDDMENNLQLLAHFDLAFARAQLALAWKCVRAISPGEQYLKLIEARHPALAKPVPLNLELGNGRTTMVVTGPNTGGKTVVLKTVGLLALMNQSGLQIPARDGSALSLFGQVFADIGDEQSISQSLSTFSSHISQIKGVLENSTALSLVLLDEIGAGTEPAEGAALAMTILLALTRKGCLTLSTTHYGALKAFVQQNSQMLNAAMEFDREKLQPTYRLIMGVPGASYGIEIASRLGLSPEVISDARSRIDSKSVQLEELITFLEQVKRRAEQKELKALDEMDQAKSLKEEYRSRLEGIQEELNTLKQKAAEESRNILTQARSAAEQAVAVIKGEQASKQSIIKAREMLKEAEALLPPEERPQPAAKHDPGHVFQKGEKVYLTDLKKEGLIVDLLDSGKKLKVQVGNVLMTVPRQKAAAGASQKLAEPKPISTVSAENVSGFAPELYLLGMRADESIEAVERYIDDAVYYGITKLRIVHGKGTGVLRKIVKEVLTKNAQVKFFRLGEWNEGQDGVTVVELK